MLPAPRLALLLQLLIAGGCMATHRGLVSVPGSASHERAGVQLSTPEGRVLDLRSTEELRVLRALDGCTVEVTGPLLARSLLVEDWRVLDAGDGSAPYVGTLRQHGSNLVIDDRNSGMPLVLDQASADRLAQHAGSQVMISGYIIGAQLLHAVTFRILVE
jgi:hypothetical protein